MPWRLLTAVLLCVAFGDATRAFGQDPSYRLYLTDIVGTPGADVTTRVLLDNNGLNLEGWSFGVCHELTELAIAEVQAGATTLTANAGAPAEFSQIDLTVTGWSTSVVISIDGSATLPAGNGYELNVATYVPMSTNLSQICFCDTVGTPSQPIFVDTGILTVLPETECANVIVEGGIAPFSFSIPGDNVYYFPVDGLAQFQLCASIAENPDNLGFPSATNAFNMSLSHDPSLVTALSAELTGNIRFLNGGFGPDFFGFETFNVGITASAIYDFAGVETYQFPTSQEVVCIQYESNPDSLRFDLDGDTTVIRWDDTAATPDEPNVIFVNNSPLDVAFFDGVVQFIPIMGTQFIRGDCNFDGEVDLGDGIGILRTLFSSLVLTEDCPAACDANEDQVLSLTDAMFLIFYRFNNGPPPSAPFPFCGPPNALDNCTQIHLRCP